MEELNLKNFANREIAILADLLNLYAKDKLSNIALEYFGELTTVGFNPNSGCVWLQDDGYNCLMYNDGNLDLWINTPYEGREGFLSDLVNGYDPEDFHHEDLEYMQPMLQYCDNLPENWEKLTEQGADNE